MKQYDDIIHLPRPISKSHKPMPVSARAVQFSPFAALQEDDTVDEPCALDESNPLGEDNGKEKVK